MDTYTFPTTTTTTTDVASNVTHIAIDLKNRYYSALIPPIIAAVCEFKQYRRADVGFLFEYGVIPHYSLLLELKASSYHHFRLGMIYAIHFSHSRHVVGDSLIVALLLIMDYEGFHLSDWGMLKDLSFITKDDLLGQILYLNNHQYKELRETARNAVIAA